MAWILRGLFFFGMSKNFVQTTDWVDNVTRYIAEESGARQAMLLTNHAGNKGIASPIIDEAIVKLAQTLPVVRINIADDQDVPRTSCVDSSGDPIPATTAATLYLLIHDFRDAGMILPSTSFIDAVAEMASFDYHPKYLILSAVPVLSDSLEELLQYAWTKKMLDLTILEWSEKRVSKRSIIEHYEFSLPIVHRLNPFKQEYKRSNWSANSRDLFPKKVNDMAGYPLRVVVPNAPPFSVSAFNELDEPIFVGGATVLLVQSIAYQLNASLKYLSADVSKNSNVNPNDSHTYYYNIRELTNADVSAYIHSRVSTSRCASLHTTAITVDELTAIVPILPGQQHVGATNLYFAVLLSSAVVVIYCAVARVLRFSDVAWQPFTIARLFFGISVSQHPRRTVERLMLASLLAISAIYSSNIYTALTDVSLLTTGEMPFDSIEDLENSGLIPTGKILEMNRTFHGADGALKNLNDKRNLVNIWPNNVTTCLRRVAIQKDAMCLLDKSRAAVLVARSRTNGHLTMKLAKTSFWSSAVTLDVGKRSPYRFYIDTVISRMQSAGLVNKLYEDAKNEAVEHNDNEDPRVLEVKQNMIALRRQFLTLAVICYTIAILVFIGEIVVHRVSTYIKSKRQPIVLFPYTE